MKLIRLGVSRPFTPPIPSAWGRAVTFVAFALTLPGWMAGRVDAAPRMISYSYPNCVSCHVSVQGRGLLNKYGRGIDMEQSYSDRDLTADALGYVFDHKYVSGDWDGTFGNVLADFTTTMRLNQEFDTDKTDPTFSAIYRQIMFFGPKKQFRVNVELGYRDTDLRDARLGPNLTANGGDRFFFKKLMLEYRLKSNGSKSGTEIAVGRDYLPIGLQVDDHSTYILHLNRNGIYDYPFQVKYFTWTDKFLASAYLYAPSFEEGSSNQEYGGGFLYEYYPTQKLAVGVQSLVGFADDADRWRVGGYVRWGISQKWALLAELDYTRFWDVGAGGVEGDQWTAMLQLHYHHTEWLVSSFTGNLAASDFLRAGYTHLSGRYTLSARLNRNVTVGLSYTAGDIRRSLRSGQEGALFANFKF